jgi:hypothetical protein
VTTVEPPAELPSEEAEIPLEEIEEIADELEEDPLDGAATGPASAVTEDDLDFAALERLVQASHEVSSNDRVVNLDEVHPLARLLEQLWGRQGDAGVIEVQLESGETLVPQFYAATQSRRSHAFIAVGESEDKYSVIAIPWQSVSRITIRGLAKLPEEFT